MCTYKELVLLFFSDHALQIRILRAIDFQGLLGTVGGYIGLILGYTVIQLPEFLATVFGKMRTTVQRFVNKQNQRKVNSICVLPRTIDTTPSNGIQIETKYGMENIDDFMQLKIRKWFKEHDDKLDRINSKLNNAILKRHFHKEDYFKNFP